MGKKQEERKKIAEQRQKALSVKIGLAVLAIFVPILAVALVKRELNQNEEFSDITVNYPLHTDVRHASCPKGVRANCKPESVTIIIPYLDEEWFRIQATMQSIVKYTDLSLVDEIMWIADGCAPEKVFSAELKAFHPKVSVYENEKNLGLITTKMQAASRAKGSILLFLEPHILVTPGWLPPMLNRIADDPKVLVMPTLDVLDERLYYIKATHGHWRFEWNMNIVYTNPLRIPEQGDSKPYISPATSGGIYAIRKDWWDQLDFFDPELIRWGGDHVEASHKVWRCGGRIEILPCSRVAHWFRVESNRPYDVKVQSVTRNYKRLTEVWLDNYTHIFYKLRSDAKNMGIGNIEKMKERREQLGCKDMTWYINNVDLELRWEQDKACVPGADWTQGGCVNGKKAAEKMSSITDAIPVEDYKRLMASADAFK